MSRKKDPLTAVIQYFTTAPNDDLERTLLVVKEIVRSRSPLRAARNSHKKKPAPPGGGVSAASRTLAEPVGMEAPK